MNSSDYQVYIVTKLNTYNYQLDMYYHRLQTVYSDEKEREKVVKSIISLINDASKIVHQFNLRSVKLNNFCNTLLLLKKFNIKEVDLFLNEVNYEPMLFANFEQVLMRIDNNIELSAFDYDVVEAIIPTGRMHDEDKKDLYERLIRDVIIDNKHISMSSFVNMMCDYTMLLMSKYTSNPKCMIIAGRKLENDKVYMIQEIIYLNREELESMYVSCSYEMLVSIYAVVDTLRQKKNIYSSRMNDEVTLRERKEEFIITEVSTYYDENKFLLTSYFESQAMALKELLKFFERTRIDIQDKKYIKDKIDEYKKLMYSSKRKLKGKDRDIDEIFNELIVSRPDLFELYSKMSSRKDTNDQA